MHTCESASERLPVAPEPAARLEAHNVALLSSVRAGPGVLASIRFALEQRLFFGLGLGRAAAARAWYRRYDWIQTRRRLGTLGAVRALLKRPGRIARDAWRAAAAHGEAVRARHGTSVRAQRAQLFWLGLRWGLDPESYYRFWLFKPERRKHAGLYIQQHEAGLLYRVLSVRDAMHDFAITEDKRRFEAWCRDRGFPTVVCLAEFEAGSPRAGGGAASVPSRPLFSKPVDSFGGAGARRWDYAGGERWRTPDGDLCDREALLATLADQSRAGAVVLQECLENDPRITHLSSGALCTARILTVRPPGGKPELVCGLFRMAAGGQSTDNFSIAGIAAPIDLDTGTLGAGVRSDPALVIEPVDHHPDTGATIAGTRLPWWDEAKALALQAHAALPAIACVGWDVALTADGPVLVEANWAPGARLAQAPSGVPLGATNFMRYLDAHMKRSFGAQVRDPPTR